MKNKQKRICGFRIKNRKGIKPYWKNVLNHWILMHETYCKVMNDCDDAIYLYTERANVGVLSGAAWKAGLVALQEGNYEKENIKSEWNGFADLYIASDVHEEMIEAKRRWVSLKSQNLIKIGADILTLAVNDVKETCGKNDGMDGLGIAFLIFYLPSNKSKSSINVDALIENAVKSLCASQAHICAWVFPKEKRIPGPKEKNFTPGIVMLVSNQKYA